MKKIDVKKRLTNLFLLKKKGKTPLKRSMSGYETETFILDSKGDLDHSDKLFSKVKKELHDTQQECAKSMIEMSCLPAKRLKTTSQSLVDNLIQLTDIAKKNERLIYPFGTYFGKNEPIFRKKVHYQIKRKILGDKKFRYAGYCCGCHQHYDLPKGLFDKKNKNLKDMKNSKINKTLIDSYNLMTAVDPILTTLTQSSPYIDGKPLGKNSRVIVYRGGNFLGFKDGVYSKHRLFGALSPYKATVKDLSAAQKRRYEKWSKLVSAQGYDTEKFAKKENMLAYSWTPVKINPHGTLEYRGYDMNFISTLFGASTMLKFALRSIQQNFMTVVPLDIQIKESFKVENNMLFIPPFSTVTKLQKKAAYAGLEDDDVNTYVKNFYDFARKVTSENYLPLLTPTKNMLESRKTHSDRITAYFRRRGHRDKLPQNAVREAALKFSEDFSKDLHDIKNRIDKIEY